ncbi:alpha/beta hydrolase [Corallincola holothuriorum]|uniref:Alpha/beta hydrolase n=1 Tax=Corallincola holothuriorum TaxID=2282215 RepID=A0A368NIV7_9GAMM|nr:alpha/beta hydrolase [Corallincola holothuriorum]
MRQTAIRCRCLIYEHQLNVEGRLIAALSTSASVPDNPLLCLHGWLDNAASFIPMMQAAPSLPWLAIDWPGHGGSAHREGHYHLVDYVDDLYGVQRLFDSKLSIVGHSLGGLVASIYAGSFPEKVRRLVSIEAVGPMAWPAESAPQILRKAMISRRKQAVTKRCYHSIVDAVAARMAAQACLPREAAELLVERNLIKDGGRWYWRSDPKLRTLSPLRITSEQAEAWVRAIRCPTLIIEGQSGFQEVKLAIHERLGWFADARHKQLVGGHHLHMERGGDTVELIRDFV